MTEMTDGAGWEGKGINGPGTALVSSQKLPDIRASLKSFVPNRDGPIGSLLDLHRPISWLLKQTSKGDFGTYGFG